MKTRIIVPLMALALLLTACGKNASDRPNTEQPAGKTALKNVASAKTPAMLNLRQTEIEPDDVFSVSRKGEKVTIRWNADFSACKGISILRNDVGLAKNRQVVASLPASSTEYVDTVPNTYAYWYWLDVQIDDKKSKRIGPTRAKADTGKTGEYTDVSKDITFNAQRTQSSVIVDWDLPNGKYRNVVIWRRHKPEFLQGRNQRTKVHTSTERSGDFTDSLTDSNSDYWYWIDVTKEDGSVLSKGPVKAEYGGASKSSSQPTIQPQSQPKVKTNSKTKGPPNKK